MTQSSPYVTLRPFRFGSGELQPGDPVPVETGRDYHALQQQGYIGLANPALSVPVKPDTEVDEWELSSFDAGEQVIVVYDGGEYDRATFKHFETADEEAQGELGLKPGDLVATVATDENPDEPFTVPLSSVLPLHPAGLLLDYLEGRARENHEAVVALGSKDQEVTALKGRMDFLELLLKAIRTEGTPLADDTPTIKELQANHITTQEGLKLLADGERGRANLIALDKIGEKSADKILAFLNPPKGD